MEKLNVPKLRFSGFENSWKGSKFGDIVNVKSKKYNPLKNNDSFKCIELEHLSSGSGELLGFIDSKDAKSIKNIFKKGDVLFGKLRPYLRKYLYTSFEGVCSSEIWVFTGEKVSNEFLFQIVKTDKFIEKTNQSSGSKMPRADWNLVADYELYIPLFPEQKKIASFLTSIDDKIELLNKKKALLEQYKKGVMQKIFNQEIRFKDESGKDYPNWEEKSLGEISELKKIKNKDGAITEVLTNSATRGIIRQNEYFDNDIANQNNLYNYYIVDIGDFVYNPRISTFAPVGPIKRNKTILGVMSPLYTVFKFKIGILDFFEYFFETNLWHTFMESIANYGARHDRMAISNKDFLQVPLPFPLLLEQTKIAHFLSSIDDKINAVNEQITKTQTYKTGLLQQMFV